VLLPYRWFLHRTKVLFVIRTCSSECLSLPKLKKDKDDQHALPSLSLVFGYIAVKELTRLQDRVDVLLRLGYGNAEIAQICGTTPTAVSVMKFRSHARQRGRRAKAL
jgi:hypothetical protein